MLDPDDLVLVAIRVDCPDAVQREGPGLGPVARGRARRIVSVESATRILILTTFDLDEYAFEALRAGASGFLLKDAPAEDIVHAVRTVARGDATLAPSVTRRMVERYAARPRPDAFPALATLTAR